MQGSCNTMARSLSLVVVTVAIFSLLMPAPLVLSAAIRPPPVKIGRYFTSSAQVKRIGNFLKKHLKDVIDEVLQLGQKQGGDNKLDTAAADTAGLYTFDLSVGTSVLQNFTGILDITTELVWAQCAPCTICLPPPATEFEPSRSGTFSSVPCESQTCLQNVANQTCPAAADDTNCSYLMQYANDTSTTGYLATDTFTFGQTPVPGVVFGCGSATLGDFYGASGVLGFNRGNLSLVSQLQLSWFSYRLASDKSDSGDNLLEFGNDAVLPPPTNGQATPLVINSVYPYLYFVNLTGVKVGDQVLSEIPAGTFDIQPDGSGGAFLSTTIPVTYLEEAAYNVIKQELAKRIKSEPVNGSALGLDLCYTVEDLGNSTVPKLTLVFDGAEMELKKHNYFFADDNTTGLECLTILPSRGGSLLGSLMQTDTNMTYDIYGGQLIFETASSSAAPPPHLKVYLMILVQLVAWALLFY